MGTISKKEMEMLNFCEDDCYAQIKVRELAAACSEMFYKLNIKDFEKLAYDKLHMPIGSKIAVYHNQLRKWGRDGWENGRWDTIAQELCEMGHHEKLTEEIRKQIMRKD